MRLRGIFDKLAHALPWHRGQTPEAPQSRRDRIAEIVNTSTRSTVRTRKQIRGRAAAMQARKVNRQRLIRG